MFLCNSVIIQNNLNLKGLHADVLFGAKLSVKKILTSKWALLLATYVAFSPNSRFPLTSQSNKRNLDGSNIGWL